MGSFYRSRHELFFAFRKGRAPHVNSFELGQHGRHRTNVWEYKGANTRRAGRLEELALHPTAKPVQMIADAIKDVSARGEIVLDLFGGSGSTLIAAQKTGRRARLVELDPVYCDRILARWEAQARDEADLLLDRVPAGRRGRRSCQWECGSPGGGGGMSRRDHDDLDEDHTRGQPGRSARSPGQGGLPALRGARLARPTAHEVGYGEPPAEHRFPKGRSGNPKGRPRGAKGKTSGVPSLKEERLKQIVLEEAYRTITVRDGERAVTVPMAQAVIRSLAVNAAKGQHRAQRLFAELLAGTETANRRLHDEWLNAAMSYKVE